MTAYQTRSINLTAKGCTAVNGEHTLGCTACGARAVTELPEGFNKVSVVVSDSELRWLRARAARQPRGTYSEAIRTLLDRPASPYGFLAAFAAMTNNNEE